MNAKGQIGQELSLEYYKSSRQRALAGLMQLDLRNIFDSAASNTKIQQKAKSFGNIPQILRVG